MIGKQMDRSWAQVSKYELQLVISETQNSNDSIQRAIEEIMRYARWGRGRKIQW